MSFTHVGTNPTNIFCFTVAVYRTGIQNPSPFTIQASSTTPGEAPVTIGECTIPSTCSTSYEDEWHYCFFNFNLSTIPDLVSSEQGGTISILYGNVKFAATCPYDGYAFVAQGTLTKNSIVPTYRPTTSVDPTSAGPTDSSTVNLVTTNVPFIFSFVIAMAASLFGVVLVSNRMKVDKESKLYHPSYLTTILHFGLFTSAYASQIFFAYVCFSHEQYVVFGIAFVTLRGGNMLASLFILYRLLQRYQHEEQVFDKQHFLQNKKVYTVVVLLSLLDSNFLMYLSWKNTAFVTATGGYPDDFFFTFCKSISIAFSISMSILQTAFAIYTSEETGGLQGFALVSLYFSFALSLAKAGLDIAEMVLVKFFMTPPSSSSSSVTTDVEKIASEHTSIQLQGNTTVENPVLKQ